jgi:hypothetical protein
MTDKQHGFQRVAQTFRDAGIKTDKPGFYDDPRFLAIETGGRPEFLFEYGRFVCWRDYNQPYLDRAEKIIRIVAEEVHRGLVIQNLQGACVVTTMILQRILDRHGVWSCIVKGGVRLSVLDSDIEPFTMCPIDLPAPPGKQNIHSWIFAPPFTVVDLTVGMQGHEPPLSLMVPKIVLAKTTTPTVADTLNLISPQALQIARERGYSASEVIAQELPIYTHTISKEFSPFVITEGRALIKYVPTGFGGSDGDLPKINGYTVNGKSAWQFYNAEIKPKLKDL